MTDQPSGAAVAPRGLMEKIKLYVDFTRPFTLLPPTLGVLSGAATAFGSSSNPDPMRRLTFDVILTVLLGSACAALLNAASNVINQYYDLEIDRLNKPKRPLVSGLISMKSGWWYAVALYIAAIIPTWFVVVYPYTGFAAKMTAPLKAHECLLIYLLGMIFTFIYSAPGLGRTKKDTLLANLTISIPRGMLLKVAGWSMVASIFHFEPWYIGGIFMFFLIGAASTKDFSDMAGDKLGGCNTLPIRFGVRKAAYIIAPFFVLPWILLPVGAYVTDPLEPEHTILTGNPLMLTGLGILLILWGGYTCYLILRNPEDLATTENHPSWTHMYLMMMSAQVGFALAYLL
jgi:geranylgeranylglycerol-phosphate geranylgeranyltransferase